MDTNEMGFEWAYGPVSKEAGPNRTDRAVIREDAPYVRVTDVVKFETAFPGKILQSLNGTSIKVRCQGVTRPAILKDRNVSNDELQTRIINAMKNIRSGGGTRTVVKFRGLNGQDYASELEMQQANIAHLVDSGVPADIARQVATQTK